MRVLKLETSRESGKVRVRITEGGASYHYDLPRSRALTWAAQLTNAARDRSENDVYSSETVLEESA